MNNLIEDLILRLNNLNQIYEEYIFNHPHSNLEVSVQNRSITFKLIEEFELVDEFNLTFKKYETRLYQYISTNLLTILFDKSLIHQKENVFYNQARKPNLLLFIFDEEVLAIIKELSNASQEEIEKQEKLMRRNTTIGPYPIRFMDSLDERINFSKKMLREVGKWL